MLGLTRTFRLLYSLWDVLLMVLMVLDFRWKFCCEQLLSLYIDSLHLFLCPSHFTRCLFNDWQSVHVYGVDFVFPIELLVQDLFYSSEVNVVVFLVSSIVVFCDCGALAICFADRSISLLPPLHTSPVRLISQCPRCKLC